MGKNNRKNDIRRILISENAYKDTKKEEIVSKQRNS